MKSWIRLLLILSVITAVIFFEVPKPDVTENTYEQPHSLEGTMRDNSKQDYAIRVYPDPEVQISKDIKQKDKTPAAGKNTDVESAKADDGKGSSPGEAHKSLGRAAEYFMTFDELKSMEGISLRDKLTAMTILRKVKSDELKKLLDIANGGITASEFEQAEQLLKNALSSDDYIKLMELLARNRSLYAEGQLAR